MFRAPWRRSGAPGALEACSLQPERGDTLWPGLRPPPGGQQHYRCSEQSRRKAVTQSHGATAGSPPPSLAGPPAKHRWRPFCLRDPAGGYTVWVRPLGKPDGSSKTALCGTVTITTIDPVTGLPVTTTDVLCSLGHVATRTKGKQSFTNVTPELTTITLTADITCGTNVIPAGVTLSLFDPCVQNFFWDYDNNGLKLLQVRFYPAAT